MSECIYNFVEQSQPKKVKKPIYRSKYDPNGPLIGSTLGMHGTTAIDGRGFHSLKQNHVVISSFGRESEAPNPKTFLRKGTREHRNEENIPSVDHHDCNKVCLKPPVPTRNDKAMMGLETTRKKNYITSNALEAIRGQPKKRKGDEPRYTQREDYGKVPAYLANVKAEIENEKALVEMYVAEQNGNPSEEDDHAEMMDEGERRELINKLKQRWDTVNASYHKMAHKAVFDTPSEVKRKASQEDELKQLENDIEMLSRDGPIFIKQ
ncbi:enkurin domain-containing protein [Skeletonema marinoi]|uniref:Enkurin domain-containing protein n=1 Tax=Skeletonema marinoi TaxID=267567 RepID=A0AAD8YLZ9_9STRA|nr:enkurin domain-containing protein [Skeletonema marinoi]